MAVNCLMKSLARRFEIVAFKRFEPNANACMLCCISDMICSFEWKGRSKEF